ncbi:MAG: hydroxypyruvate isomerase [Alphaproteobacteria bacterium]|nr:MAG: hydroxypyruvate isomerase [Alphaproteobacteria bacterium]
MVQFAANLSMLFNEVEFPERFAAAAQAGFKGVEYLFPYDYPADDIAGWLTEAGVKQVLFNTPAGDWNAGERGLACNPSRKDEFREGVATAITYAQALGCTQLHCMAGIAPEGASAEELRQTYVDNLKYAAAEMGKAGIKCLIEMINTRDIPGFYLNRSAQAEEILESVGSDNLYIQYDIYHMQIMEGDLAPTIERLLPRIAHMQLADTPGRHEPGTGEINYDFLFRHIDSLGYKGWIGCEYKPATTTLEGLGWMEPYK